MCMSNLACVYSHLGLLERAENLSREVYQRQLVLYGELHADTMLSLNNLAHACARQSKHQVAEELYKKALELAKRVFGLKHQQTLMIAGNYADVLWALGKNKEALQLRTKTFQTKESMLPAERDDVDFAFQAAKLADHRHAEGEWEETKRPLVGVLMMQHRELGPKHCEVASSMTSLATLCRERNFLRAPPELTSQAYMIGHSTVGDQSPNTVNASIERGECFGLLGIYGEARISITEGLDFGRSLLGSEHLTCVAAKEHLAALLVGLGELENARDLYIEQRDYAITHYGLGHKTSLFIQT